MLSHTLPGPATTKGEHPLHNIFVASGRMEVIKNVQACPLYRLFINYLTLVGEGLNARALGQGQKGVTEGRDGV